MCELFGKLYACDFANQNFCRFGYGYARKLCNFVCRLTDDFRIQCAVDNNGLSDLFEFVFFQEITAACSKFLFDRLINLVEHDNRLLGSTNHTVVKGFRVNN